MDSLKNLQQELGGLGVKTHLLEQLEFDIDRMLEKYKVWSNTW